MSKSYTTPEQEQFWERVANTRRQFLSISPDLLPVAVAMTSSTQARLGVVAGEVNPPVVVDETMPEGGFGLRLILVVSADGEVVQHG